MFEELKSKNLGAFCSINGLYDYSLCKLLRQNGAKWGKIQVEHSKKNNTQIINH